MPFYLPDLQYEVTALEPYIDASTMVIHHTKHHQTYINNLNNAIVGTASDSMSIEDILNNVSSYSSVVRNNGGGHYNHSFFWQALSPNSKLRPSGSLANAIEYSFGNYEKFKLDFTAESINRFGSGWAWLYVDKGGLLKICSTPNQDNPLMDVVPQEHRGIPILGLDVWEHAYYLHYQNQRAKYIEAFWNVINWSFVEQNYKQCNVKN
jgi:Fe-Mn family superoxide dismutase